MEDKKKKGVPRKVDKGSIAMGGMAVVLLPFIMQLVSLGITLNYTQQEWARLLWIIDKDNNGELSLEEIDQLTEFERLEIITSINRLQVDFGNANYTDVNTINDTIISAFNIANLPMVGDKLMFYIQSNPLFQKNLLQTELASYFSDLERYIDGQMQGYSFPPYSLNGLNVLDKIAERYNNEIKFNAAILGLLELGLVGGLYLKSRKSREISREQSQKAKREISDIDEHLMEMKIAKQNIQMQIYELTSKQNDIKEGKVIPVEIEGQSNLEAEIARLTEQLNQIESIEFDEGSESEEFGKLE